MDNKTFVSVIVVSDNNQFMISKTLDSLINQTWKNIEIIVVDDASTDNSVAIIQDYVQRHKNIFLYTNKDTKKLGIGGAITEALKHCHGDWVAFCDTDSSYAPKNIEEKVHLSNRDSKMDLIVNSLYMDGGQIWDSRYINWAYKILNQNRTNIFKFFTPNNPIMTLSSVMVRKSVLTECNFNSPEESWLDFWLLRQIAFNHKIGFIDNKLSVWYKSPENFTGYEKQNNFYAIQKLFLKESDTLLRDKYSIRFWIKRYGNYIFGKTQTHEVINYWLFGISILSIENKFFNGKSGYKIFLLKYLPVFSFKKHANQSINIEWRFINEQ